jgi:hypothetical protein
MLKSSGRRDAAYVPSVQSRESWEWQEYVDSLAATASTAVVATTPDCFVRSSPCLTTPSGVRYVLMDEIAATHPHTKFVGRLQSQGTRLSFAEGPLATTLFAIPGLTKAPLMAESRFTILWFVVEETLLVGSAFSHFVRFAQTVPHETFIPCFIVKNNSRADVVTNCTAFALRAMEHPYMLTQSDLKALRTVPALIFMAPPSVSTADLFKPYMDTPHVVMVEALKRGPTTSVAGRKKRPTAPRDGESLVDDDLLLLNGAPPQINPASNPVMTGFWAYIDKTREKQG